MDFKLKLNPQEIKCLCKFFHLKKMSCLLTKLNFPFLILIAESMLKSTLITLSVIAEKQANIQIIDDTHVLFESSKYIFKV